jgi:uncharacterized protein (TIGR00730 family)
MNICVFCGSSTGKNGVYAEAARELGFLLATEGHALIYGGGNIGLMGILADTVLENKGTVIGVIPDFLMQKEVGHKNLSKLEVVSSMHERKRRMADLADAFIVIPGGWGTLDETAEILTWRQLGLIQQPVGLINVAGFFDFLLAQMNQMVAEGFLHSKNMDFITVERSPEKVLRLLLAK